MKIIYEKYIPAITAIIFKHKPSQSDYIRFYPASSIFVVKQNKGSRLPLVLDKCNSLTMYAMTHKQK